MSYFPLSALLAGEGKEEGGVSSLPFAEIAVHSFTAMLSTVHFLSERLQLLHSNLSLANLICKYEHCSGELRMKVGGLQRVSVKSNFRYLDAPVPWYYSQGVVQQQGGRVEFSTLEERVVREYLAAGAVALSILDNSGSSSDTAQTVQQLLQKVEKQYASQLKSNSALASMLSTIAKLAATVKGDTGAKLVEEFLAASAK